MKDVVIRNVLAEQYICGARKTFRSEIFQESDSDSKMLIGHISDIHGDVIRLSNAMDLFNHYAPEFVVCTGDNVYWNMSEDFHYIANTFSQSSIPAYICIGNHDTFMDKPSTTLPRHECGVLLRNEDGIPLTNDYLHQVFVEEMKNVEGDADKAGYFYVDFEKRGVRLIVLNDYEYYHENCKVRNKYTILERQANWLIEVLKDAAQKEYGVIIADHEGPGKIKMGEHKFCQRVEPFPWGKPKLDTPCVDMLCDIVNAYKHAETLCCSYHFETSNQTVTVNCTFEKPGEFIAYLSGHRHGDYVGFLEKYPDQLSLNMPCSCCDLSHYQNTMGETASDLPRIPGTVSEDCINFYVIDREKKQITIVRVGAFINDTLDQRLFERINY